MKRLKRIFNVTLICLLIAALVASVGCSEGGSSSNGNTSEVKLREEYKAEEESVFVDTDGDFEYETVDWDGPAGYTIIIPTGDKEAKKSAEVLVEYYKQALNTTLKITTDAAKVTNKEILIGDTNREESDVGLADGELSVSLKNGKLVFSGSHYVTVGAAVEKFARLSPEKGKAFTFSLKTDFKATVKDGYEYVWGDEFEGSDLNFRKWNFYLSMKGDTERLISYDKDIINVEDGRLKLHVRQYFDPTAVNYKYKVPYAVAHDEKMNFLYGYAEIRAKVPFFTGIWPSWWGQSTCELDGVVTPERSRYFTEVDIFEIFGSASQVVPNLHKWYTKDYGYGEIHGTGSNHTSFGIIKAKEVEKYDYLHAAGVDVANLDNEYHVYGFEWTKKEMIMSVDGNDYMTFDITKSYDLEDEMDGFHVPMFFMFNCHMTTSNSEDQTAGLIENSLDSLPAQYYIDYYRVYQKPDVGKIYINDELSYYPDRK